MFHLTSQDLILAGVGASLSGSLARAVFTKPKQRAQINAIEAKVDAVLSQLSQGLQTTQAALRASNRAAASTSDLTLALAPLIPVPATAKPDLTIAQGGA